MKIRVKYIENLALGILVLPNIIFALGWLKLIYTIPVLFGIGYIFVTILRKTTDIEMKIPVATIITMLALSLVIIWSCGIGGGYAQGYDYSARNAIFRDLIEREWPVYYGETNNALVYYFGYWLPAALLGKILNGAENIFLLIYSSFTLFIFFLLVSLYFYKYFITKSINKIIIVIMGTFVAFAPIHIWGFVLRTVLHIGSFSDISVRDINHWSDYGWQDGFWTQLMNVYNQTIPALLATALWFIKRDNFKIYGGLLLFLLIQSPYSAIGLFIIMLFYLLYNIINKKQNFRIIFSSVNIISILILPIFYFLFSDMKYASPSIKDINLLNIKQYLIIILAQVFIYFCPYFILLYKKFKNNILYWFILLFLQ